MKRLWRRDQRAQLHVVEAIIVGVLVFTILFVTSVFRLPTSASTFQQAELAGLADDTLVALLAKPPTQGSDCNESPCPFGSELERLMSLALGFEGATTPDTPATASDPSTSEVVEYLVQALPPGTRYILSYSNGVSTTTIHPKDLVPPALDVSVGHLFMTFNWNQFGTEVDDSMIIRIDETTGFKTAEVSSINDPLNRVENEKSPTPDTMISLFTNAAGTKTVPENIVYGTYKVCRAVATDCTYFTVVPPGIFGAGSSILTKDRDNTTSLVSAGAFGGRLKYADVATAGFSAEDALYLDLTTAGSDVSRGDLRLTIHSNCRLTKPCAAGTRVDSGDTDVTTPTALLPVTTGFVRATQTGTFPNELEEGDAVYLSMTAPYNVVSEGDRRLTRVGSYAFGSIATAGDSDLGTTLLSAFTSETVRWGDLDAGGLNDIDLGEPVYLDFEGHGQSSGLEAYDIHLSPKGNPTTRYVYDIRLVVWYGI